MYNVGDKVYFLKKAKENLATVIGTCNDTSLCYIRMDNWDEEVINRMGGEKEAWILVSAVEQLLPLEKGEENGY